jgi:hypothetical protein
MRSGRHFESAAESNRGIGTGRPHQVGMQDPGLIADTKSPAWKVARKQEAACEQIRRDTEIDTDEFFDAILAAAENGDQQAQEWYEHITGEPFIPLGNMPGVYVSPDITFDAKDF